MSELASSPAPAAADRVDVRAAGAVLWRPGPAAAGVEVALVHRPRYDDWSFPKGKLGRGEAMPFAAVREATEETGFAARLGHLLGDVRYAVPEGRKLVRYWAARAGEGAFVANDETDALRWCSPDQAGRLLSYHHDLDVLRRFDTVGLPTSTVLLVRHAKAGSRRQWDGDDAGRPLSGSGREQAARLAALLALFGPDRLATAPPLRCRDTLVPFAAAAGMDTDIPVEPLLGEDRYLDAPIAGRARLAELAARPGVTAVCSQGGVIPHLVGALAGDLPMPRDAAGAVHAKKASTWVLSFRAGRVVAADYYPRPTG